MPIMSAETIRSQEFARTPEQIHPKYDALLVHGYWMSDKTIRKHQEDGAISERHITAPALRTHFAARAATLAWDEGRGAGKIVLDLGHLWGPDYPTEGKIIADALVNKYHVPREAIILRENAYSTYGEVKTVLELARENGWSKIMDVGFRAHHLTIPGIYKSKELKGVGPANLRVDYEAVESILDKDDKRVIAVRRKFAGLTRKGIRYGLTYIAYEGLKRLYMFKPGFKYEPLEQANKDVRTKPMEVWIPPIVGRIPGVAKKVAVDKYNLPPEEKAA